MPNATQTRPRLIPILMVLLILQSTILIFLGLNSLTHRWSFLTSWPRFWMELQEAVALVLKTPGETVRDEILFYDVLLFATIEVSAAVSLMAGLAFPRGKRIAWILALLAQIGTLASGLSLYFMHRAPQAYWLMALGIIMVLYLNYRDVRQWFLLPREDLAEGLYV
ncbi:MAG TPA: hypothetical protein PKZ33_07140 [Brevefilum sp.]|nr:hypothetical protein [Brevefilum sp.]